jgi:hypothetical protein
MTFTEAMNWASEAFEFIAAMVLAAGLLWSVALALVAWRRSRDGRRAYGPD